MLEELEMIARDFETQANLSRDFTTDRLYRNKARAVRAAINSLKSLTGQYGS